MKNLTVHCQNICYLNKSPSDTECIRDVLQSNPIISTDPDNNELYILAGNRFFVISCDQGTLITSKHINVDSQSKPIGLVGYLTDFNTLYCAYDSGEIFQSTPGFGLNDQVSKHIDEGIKCMEISPDEEIIVVVTCQGTAITMMSNLQVISTVALFSADFGEQQFITAGWGHKETQFHGKEGKAAAKAKVLIVPRTERDSGSTRITWRDEADLFAVSFLHEQNNARQFKVFNREGILQYTSELTHGLEDNICWKPSGSLIATTQRLQNKHVVALFEKNGLRHRDFLLPFETNEVNVKSLSWSPDSQILAVWCQATNSKTTTLQLWTENNYHWYLKQTINFSESNPLIYYSWNKSAKKELLLWTKMTIIRCDFRWTISHSCGGTADNAVVGVIDGNKALLTAFKLGIVPPPMSHQSLPIRAPINEVVFGPSDQFGGSSATFNSFFCLLHDDRLVLHTPLSDNSIQYDTGRIYEIEWAVEKVVENVPFALHHFLWLKEDAMLCSASAQSQSYLCILQLENVGPNKDGRVVVRETLPMSGHIQHIVPAPEAGIAYLVIDQVLKFTHGEGITPTEIIMSEPCDQVEVVEIDKRHVIVALGRKNRLFIDGAEVASNITSFCVHPNFLLLTTLQHALVSVAMTKDGFARLVMSNLTVKSWTSENLEQSPSGLSLRRLERGSSLVTVIPEVAKVVLQMPRGNLETIQPRALSLFIVKSHLDSANYFAAFNIMRKQRINLNLIFDHNPRLFINNADKFIDDIKNSAWLNLYISELHEEDVTKSIYQSCYSEQENEKRGDFDEPKEGKVESVCKLLRTIMERKTSRNLIQPILTCLVKNKHVGGLETALRKIKEFQLADATSEGRQQTAEEALKYLLYLVDVNVLYDIALGMYDLDLTKFVASKSQKDPKEYVPYLNNLAELEENYRKYTIDTELKRYESALEHIAKCSDKFDEATVLIAKHNLYSKALKVYKTETKEYKELARMYGEFLTVNKNLYEAGEMFSRSGDYDRALRAYKMSGSWQEAIVMSATLNMTPEELNKLYEFLVTKMKDSKRYRDAAEITQTYCKHPERAVVILCEGRKWKDAMKLAFSVNRVDLITTHVKIGVDEHACELLSQIAKNKEEFIKHNKRLAVIRKEKEKRQALFLDLGNDDEKLEREVSDLLSDTSSIAGSSSSWTSKTSRSSSRSYRSSKNRRKQERKALSIKEGSAFEDLAIIRALHVIITTTYAQREEVLTVNRVLLKFYFDDIAEKLQAALQDLLAVIEKNKHDIWPKNLPTDDQNDDGNMPQCLLEPRFTFPPEAPSVHWMLDLFLPPPKNTPMAWINPRVGRSD